MFSVDITTSSHPFPGICALCSLVLSPAWQYLLGATVALTYVPESWAVSTLGNKE